MRARGHGDEGQAAVELALALPLVALLLLVVVQVGLVVRAQILVVHAAREAVREAAVDPSPEAARRAALAGSGLDPGRLTLDVSTAPRGTTTASSGRVRVTVRYRTPTEVPLVGAMVGDLRLESSASMRLEK